MNVFKNIDICRQLFSELNWSERHAGHNAFVVVCLALTLIWVSYDHDHTALDRNPTASGPCSLPAVPSCRPDATDPGLNRIKHPLKGGESMELDLTQAELPPLGTYSGVFVDVVPGNRTIKKRTYLTLSLVIEINHERSDKTRFTVERKYTLNIKGQKKLRDEYEKWRGKGKLSADELKTFNASKAFLEQPCQTTVAYETEGGRTVARAASYSPASEPKLNPSGAYKRAEVTAPKPETDAKK